MKIIVVAGGKEQSEFSDKGIGEGIQIQFIPELQNELPAGDAWFYLLSEELLQNDLPLLEKLEVPVFVNAVETTCNQLTPFCIRINGWPGFLIHPVLEVAAPSNMQNKAEKFLEALTWKHQWVPDITGMITPRTIAMIINEAYFTVEDEVSSREDIDTAMKLGTNYPYGPFEWAKKIGLKKIFNLLSALAKKDARYLPSGLLTQEAKL